jgi:dolichol-phosphate mannosyltransferase
MKVLVMLPTYNEGENLESMVQAILSLEQNQDVNQLDVQSLQIVVVDDDSPDSTGELAEKLAEIYPGKVHVIHREERGRGSAGITGFKFALTQDIDCLIEMDADFSHNPNDIPRFLKEIKNCDVVIGSRFVPGGQTGPRNPFRKATSWGAGLYARLVLRTDIKDWHGGYKCYRKQALAGLNLDGLLSRGYSIGMKMIYRLTQNGCSYKEIPITFRERTRGKSKFCTREILVCSLINRFNHMAAFARICSAVFVHRKGLAPSFHRERKAFIAPTRWATLSKLPLRIAWLVSMPNQISTMFIQEAPVGVK